MTQEEREAVERLEQHAHRLGSYRKHALTLLAMLSRPALPDVNDHAAIDELARRAGCYRHIVVCLIGALTKPRTKEVEVWRVEYCRRGDAGTCDWLPVTRTFMNEQSARDTARDLESVPALHACIRVTGPHKQEVPDEGATP
jgi:hypothetical protein